MHYDVTVKLLGLGLLTAAAGVSFTLPNDLTVPASIAADPLPDENTLTGVLRDFDTMHGDFGVVPTKGLGHYAGTVTTTLGADGLPVFKSGAGYKVTAQWTDSGGTPVAPHLFETSGVVVSGSVIMVDGDVQLRNSATIDAVSGDAYVVTNSTDDDAVRLSNSSEINGSVYVGPGGDPSDVVDEGGHSGTSGDIGVLDEAFEMPTIEEPTGMGPKKKNKTYKKSGTITGKLHVGKLTVKGAVLIKGETTILCDELALSESGEFTLDPGATLDLYVRDAISLSNATAINEASGDPSLVTIYYLGSGEIKVRNSHKMFASLIAPEALLSLKESSQFTGSLIAAGLTMDNSAELHMVEGGSVGGSEACGVYNDTPGSAGVSNNGAITSESSFDQWFKDDLDANLSVPYPITLSNDGFGNYRLFIDKSFYPLDDQAKGNEGDSHNSHFTYGLTAYFEYDSCSGQYVEFQGGDGAWIFIDERLAIDLGGVQTGQYQRFELDRFDLIDGETYQFHLFYANRNAASSTFGVRTNLLLWQSPFVATATNPFD